MADVKFETVNAALNTSTGNQDFTVSGFGTPSAAMIFLSGATADDTITAHGYTMIGFTDGTNQASFGYSSEDGQATSDEERFSSDTSFLYAPTPGTPTLAMQGSASLITDGVRINITNADSTSYLATVVLIGGSDVTNAYVSAKKLTSASLNITDPGFEPDLVFIGGTGNSSAESFLGNSIYHFGVAHNTGASVEQKGVAFAGRDGQTTTSCTTYFDSDGIAGQIFNGVLSWSAQLDTFDASGFTVTSSSIPNDFVFYLALEFSNSPDIKVFDTTSPTSTGSKTFTEPNFEPSFSMLVGTDIAALDTISTAESSGASFFIGDVTNQYTVGGSVEDAVGTSNSANISYSGGIKSLIDGTTVDHAATFTSFASTGPTFNFSTASSAKKWLGVAIGPASGSTYTLTAEAGSFTVGGDDVNLLYKPVLSADVTSYTLSGDDVNLTYTPVGSYTLTADPASYTLGADDANLLYKPVLTADVTAYVVGGDDVNLTYAPSGAYVLTADVTAYTLGGDDVNLLYKPVLTADPTAYTITFADADLIVGILDTPNCPLWIVSEIVQYNFIESVIDDTPAWVVSDMQPEYTQSIIDDSALFIESKIVEAIFIESEICTCPCE